MKMIKTPLYLFLVIVVGFCVYAQTKHIKPDSRLAIHIKSVVMSTNAVEPLQIIIELTATGKTPIALDHAQFGFKIWKPKAVAFQGDLQFYNDVTNIISIFPNTNLVVNAAINTNDLNQSWHSLAPGSYNLQIDVGSGKLRQFDYQYMGQVHSEVYSLELK